MSLPKLTENLNYISSLPDKPSTTSTELKRLFDKAGNDIKDYINNILNDAIETLITNTVRDNKTVVENVLNSTSIVNALSAAQGKVLKGLCDENKEDIKNIGEGTILYESQNGTTESFTLNDNITNYKKIDIVVGRSDASNYGNQIITVYTNNTDGIVATPKLMEFNNEAALITHTCRINFSGTNAIVSLNKRLVNYVGYNLIADTESLMTIKKVIGYI